MYYHEVGGSWDEEIGSHCTEYVQLAFMSACLSIFVGGILLILMFRVIEYSLKSLFKFAGFKVNTQLDAEQGGFACLDNIPQMELVTAGD